jgi:hypothetical protein
LLADAAAQRGLKVLTIDAQSPTNPEPEPKSQAEVGSKNALVPELLASPADVASRFAGPNLPVAAHVPLNGWVWNLERRRQWQGAMEQWRAADDLVLLVELPPASQPESVLLAENLPQLIWLADSGRPRTRETKQQLETLRHGKCRLVGAVLNHEPEPVLNL